LVVDLGLGLTLGGYWWAHHLLGCDLLRCGIRCCDQTCERLFLPLSTSIILQTGLLENSLLLLWWGGFGRDFGRRKSHRTSLCAEVLIHIRLTGAKRPRSRHVLLLVHQALNILSTIVECLVIRASVRPNNIELVLVGKAGFPAEFVLLILVFHIALCFAQVGGMLL